jgi:hypothetical protein
MRFIAHTRDVRGPTAPSVFSLRTSVFNDFLYAPVGEEDNGMVLTTLSALARLGVDPWDEAARLSELPRETATKRLASIVAGLPHGRWATSGVGDIAARLAALLPVKPVAKSQGQAISHAKRPASAWIVTFLLFLILANVVAFSVLRGREPPPPVERGQITEAAPQAPVADQK